MHKRKQFTNSMHITIQTVIKDENIFDFLCIIIRFWYCHLFVIIKCNDTIIIGHWFIQLFSTGIQYLFTCSWYRSFQSSRFDGITFLRMDRTTFLFCTKFFIEIGFLKIRMNNNNEGIQVLLTSSWFPSLFESLANVKWKSVSFGRMVYKSKFDERWIWPWSSTKPSIPHKSDDFVPCPS